MKFGLHCAYGGGVEEPAVKSDGTAQEYKEDC